MQRRLDLTSGGVSIEPVEQGDVVQFDGRTLVTVHGPRLRLLIVGGGQLSRYLAAMAFMLDYDVTVCDPREQYHEGWSSMEGVRLSRERPDDEVISMGLDGSSAVVTVTHDPKLDDLGLMEALKTSAFCVAAIGSLRNKQVRRERLPEFDLTRPQLAALRGPAGLNLGGKTPPEIAMSIIAEMTAVRCGVDLSGPLADWPRSTTECKYVPAGASREQATARVATA